MTNNFVKPLKKIAKALLILLLLFIGLLVFVTFVEFANMEKRMKAGDLGYSGLNDSNQAQDSSDTEAGDKYDLITGDGSNYSLGSDTAPITIVEFADFACPYCKKSYPIIRELILKYNQDIKFIFRDLPIIRPYSIDLALAARCAGEQGLFWPMHDNLFENQGISEKSEILALAKQSGVEASKFETCLDQEKYAIPIKKDYLDAENLEIEKTGTPVWFINGQLVAGNIPKTTFEKIINSILNK